MSELDDAVALANRVLDKPYIDPDGDISMLARQFLRATEREFRWRPIVEAPCDGTKIMLAKIVGHPDHQTSVWWVASGSWSSRWNNWNDGIEPAGLADPNYWMPLSAYGARA